MSVPGPSIHHRSTAARQAHDTSAAPEPHDVDSDHPDLFDLTDVPPLGVTEPSAIVTAARRRALAAFIALALGLWLGRDLIAPGPALKIPASALWFSTSALALAAAVFVLSRRARPRTAAALLATAVLLLGAGIAASRFNEPRADSLATLIARATPTADTATNASTTATPIPLHIRGTLLDDPRPNPRPRTGLAGFMPALESSRATLRVEAVLTDQGWARASGRLWLRLQQPLDATQTDVPEADPARGHDKPAPSGNTDPATLRAGRHLELTGLFTPIHGPTNPGETDLRPWARAHDFVGSLKIPDPDLISTRSPSPSALAEGVAEECPAMRARPGEVLSSARPSRTSSLLSSLDHTFLHLRATLRSRAAAALGPAPSLYTPASTGRTLLADLLLSEDNPADPTLRAAFTRLGLAHILAISGFHLVVLAAVSLKLITLTGDRGRLEPLLVAAAILLYLLIVPASAPVTRAGLMVLALLAAEATGRRYDRLTILLWVSCLLLVIQPADLWSLGFQLSCGLTALLLWLGERFRAALLRIHLKGTLDRPGRTFLSRRIEDTKSLIATSLLCWAIATPLIAWQTGQISPLAVLTTLIISPVIVVLLWMGFATLLISLVWPAAGAMIGTALIRAGDHCAGLVMWLDDLPGVSLRIPAMSLGLMAFATGVLLYWARFAHRRDPKAWTLTAIASLWLALELAGPLSPAPPLPRNAIARLSVLAVGDASCTILRTPDRAILWDCGSANPSFGRYDLPRAARALGAPRIRAAIISHADLRHFSAIADAAGPLGLREVLVSPGFLSRAHDEPAGPAAAALQLLRAQNIEVRAVYAGDTLNLGPARLRILSPPRDTTWTGDSDLSLIAVVEAPSPGSAGEGGVRASPSPSSPLASNSIRATAPSPAIPSLLLTGQLAPDPINSLIASNSLPRHGILQLSARGSRSALHELLLATDPHIIVASNDHPADFASLWAGTASILQTNSGGALQAAIDNDGTTAATPFHRD